MGWVCARSLAKSKPNRTRNGLSSSNLDLGGTEKPDFSPPCNRMVFCYRMLSIISYDTT